MESRSLKRRSIFGVAVEGVVPGTLALVAAGSLFILGVPLLGLFLFLVSLSILLFFRDPERIVSVESGQILSAADGKVTGRLPRGFA